MNLKRLWAMFLSRNREFFRDKASFGWNFLFPFLLIGGFAIIFGGDEHAQLKIGVFPCEPASFRKVSDCLPMQLKNLRYIEFVGFTDQAQGLKRLEHHKIDLLVDVQQQPLAYWASDTAPKSYLAEKVVSGSLAQNLESLLVRRQSINSHEVRYIDWLFPGILAMNMMFSALYGVGFVVVRYRKNGVLKRLRATPLTAFEYLSAQMLSRLFILFFSIIILWVGCELIFNFKVEGSYFDLIIMFLAGCLSLLSLGLIIASRGTSEEFANGLLTFITWPMMFLSEVWFSIEGAPDWVKNMAQIFPLTHLLKGVRMIMNDGAGLADVAWELSVLLAMTLIFLSIGAKLFSWNK
jgi:ABC-type multidrug transport system permease subunit